MNVLGREAMRVGGGESEACGRTAEEVSVYVLIDIFEIVLTYLTILCAKAGIYN